MKISKIIPVKLRNIKQPTSWAEYIVFNQVPESDSLNSSNYACIMASPRENDGITKQVDIYRTVTHQGSIVQVEADYFFIDGSLLTEAVSFKESKIVGHKMMPTKAEYQLENHDFKFLMN
jgi:hypothetical protein